MEDDQQTKNKKALDDLLSDIEKNQDVLRDAVQDARDDSTSQNEALDSDRLEDLKRILEETQNHIRRALDFIAASNVDIHSLKKSLSSRNVSKEADRVIEGVFNGENMVGSDGREYMVPPNYASKSKLVEGDILKLTITKDGSFIYKQIGPIEREKLKAILLQDEVTGDWYAVADSRRWRLLTASVTYFHGTPGDEVVILIPKNSKSLWAAVENIIKH